MGCQSMTADTVAERTLNAALLRKVLTQIETHPAAREYVLVSAHERAERILGLTASQADGLFNEANDLPEIRRQMAELIGQVRHVTIRLVPEDELVFGEARPDGLPLEIIEHQPGQPPYCYGTERGIDRDELAERAQAIADHIGVPYIDPIDPAVQARLSGAVKA